MTWSGKLSLKPRREYHRGIPPFLLRDPLDRLDRLGDPSPLTSAMACATMQYSTQGLWGRETACQVGLSGVYDLDKWRGAGMPNREVGKPALYP